MPLGYATVFAGVTAPLLGGVLRLEWLRRLNCCDTLGLFLPLLERGVVPVALWWGCSGIALANGNGQCFGCKW